MIKIRTVVLLLAVLLGPQAALITTSCSLMGVYREVTVQFPAVPDNWLGICDGLSWQLDVPGVLLEPENITLTADNCRIKLSLPKDRPVPLLAYPVFLNGERGKPAGAVHPFQTETGGVVELSWVDGYGAYITGILKLNGNLYLENFNIPRLFETLSERAGGNPWNIDSDVLLSALTWGGFREDRIRLKPLYSLTLSSGFIESDHRPAGVWVSDNPLTGAATDGKAGTLHFPELSSGLHHYVHTGNGERLVIDLKKDGFTALLIDGEKTETGTW